MQRGKMTMKKTKYTFWFITGSQHLYGEDILAQVRSQSSEIVEKLNHVPVSFPIEWKPIVTNREEVTQVIREANADENCAGIITWMHTFSPGKIWIEGLSLLQKPLLHFHTQYERDIPWDTINMDYMNLNQSAHGDREFGFTVSRLNIDRKVITGHWSTKDVQHRISAWMGTAVGHAENKKVRVVRFGDNMRNVAVTDGDKIEAQLKFGWTVDGYGIGDLVHYMNGFSDKEVEHLYQEYEHEYRLTASGTEQKQRIMEQARIELGLQAFFDEKNYNAFTTTFEDLHGMPQLPGLAAQRMMAKGYGFAGEGDWKTAAFLRVIKMITNNKRTSFMEDYTYHLEPGNEMILGSHMLEVCPTIAHDTPEIQVHPLGIGGKADPARFVFDGVEGRAVNASLIDIGHRFRLVISEVEVVRTSLDTPHLPTAKVLWKPKPDLAVSAEAWIHAGGAHHTVLSYNASVDQLLDWAEMSGIEAVVINEETTIREFKQRLKWNSRIW